MMLLEKAYFKIQLKICSFYYCLIQNLNEYIRRKKEDDY